MTDLSIQEKVERTLKKRRAAETRFRLYGVLSIAFGILALVVLFADILSSGTNAFRQTVLTTEVTFDMDYLELTPQSSTNDIRSADFQGLIKQQLKREFNPKRSEKSKLFSLLSSGVQWQLQDMIVEDRSLLGKTVSVDLIVDADLDQWMKGEYQLHDKQLEWANAWVEQERLHTRFNTMFFTNGDSGEAELAGIGGAMKGTLFTLLVTFLLSFPIGVAAAIYLEEFAPQNKITDFVEININNLAAVPSITFGLLGLAIFINIFGVPRSTPLVGGFVLTLMTLPTIIISARAAIKSVPPSIRDAAYGIGASKMQMVFHHVLPLAMPGMLTGSIIGMAQALGETAPLLMIGMIAFVVDIPSFIDDPSTVMPVQIFLWSDNPNRGFTEKTSGAIIVLLTFLIAMNAIAVTLRRRLERRW